MTLTKPIRFWQLAAIVLSVSVSIGNGEEPEARPLLVVDGETVAATIEELQRDWGIGVRVDGERKEIKRSGYALWGNYSDQTDATQLLLTDDTVLVGDLVRIEADSVVIVSRLWGEVRIDRQLVQACLLRPAADPLERDRQREMLRGSEPADHILLLNGDVVAGRLLPSTERDGDGLFGLVSLGVELSNGGSNTSVQVEAVRSITFQTPAQRAARAECLLGFRDGSLVAASKLTRSEPDLTLIGTSAGVSLKLPTDKVLKHLTFVQPQNDRITYLSDLSAVGYKSLPFLELSWPLGVATNTLGGRLRSGGNVIFKGLGMHSTSRVAYDLDRKYRRFQAELALDDHADRQGSVVYRVLIERADASGERAWNLAFTSPVVRGGDPPLPITLDVTEATRLALVVEMADRADTRDYANWLNARLLR
ncbi:MAG: NPCBM/NEW2 domain-containing protein [Planctomycetota bacterium]|nr:NPCBM/NEW2 domain-containing protein [Planctomycetota bacterium]